MKQECVVNVPCSATNLRYRAFAPADIPSAHSLSKEFGWAHRQEDWEFSAECATGVVAEERGVVIGTALCWKFGTDCASIGHVIVSAEHQGRGIGRKLMETLLEELGPRTVFLHATPAGLPVYEKMGFRVCGWLNQYQGQVDAPVVVGLLDSEQLRPATPDDFPVLNELALRASGFERHGILSSLFKLGESVVLERGREIVGFSTLRRFGRGHVIGPVVAPRSGEEHLAKALIGYWLTGRPGDFVRIDVPSRASLTDWLGTQGLKRVDTTPKMVRNAPPGASSVSSGQGCELYAVISQAML